MIDDVSIGLNVFALKGRSEYSKNLSSRCWEDVFHSFECERIMWRCDVFSAGFCLRMNVSTSVVSVNIWLTVAGFTSWGRKDLTASWDVMWTVRWLWRTSYWPPSLRLRPETLTQKRHKSHRLPVFQWKSPLTQNVLQCFVKFVLKRFQFKHWNIYSKAKNVQTADWFFQMIHRLKSNSVRTQTTANKSLHEVFIYENLWVSEGVLVALSPLLLWFQNLQLNSQKEKVQKKKHRNYFGLMSRRLWNIQTETRQNIEIQYKQIETISCHQQTVLININLKKIIVIIIIIIISSSSSSSSVIIVVVVITC